MGRKLKEIRKKREAEISWHKEEKKKVNEKLNKNVNKSE